jgi:hypothetical protein
MHTIQPKYEQSKPERSTFVLRHRGSGAAVILPLLGLLLGVLAVALALTDVPLWWLPVIVAVPLGLVDEVRASGRHSAGSSALCAPLERTRINPKRPAHDVDCRTQRIPFDKPRGSWAMEIGKRRTNTFEPLSDPAPQMKPAEKPSQDPEEPPTVVPERASAQ